MFLNNRLRDSEILRFIPEPLPLTCDRCQYFPVLVRTEGWVRRLDRQIAKRKPGPRRKKLERLREDLSQTEAITLYLHGNKEFFTFPMLKAAIPELTTTNWILVRDYIFYGPPATPTRGLGSLIHSLADRFCSRKTMHLIVLPAIADLRLEHSQAVSEARLGKALWIRIRGPWDLARTLALCVLAKAK